MRKILALSLALSLFLPLASVFAGESSGSLTQAAADALNQGKIEQARELAKKCIDTFGEEAKKAQRVLKFKGKKALEGDAKEVFEKYRVLNDVGICQFIIGESHRRAKESKEAVRAYEAVIKEYPESRMIRGVRQVFILEKIAALADSRKKLNPESKFYNIPITVTVY